MPDLYIGLMSGTSMDGIDAALVDLGDRTLDVVATHEHDYPDELRRQLVAARSDSGLRSCGDVPELHRRVGECFRDAAKELLGVAGIDASSVTAIGSHGQTLRHEPNADEPFSLQIGDADIIASGTGITTIADFRRADIELGGQGAPLAPAFHDWLFRRCHEARIVLNIGGIANITVLHADDRPTIGFDTGPGNTLLDAWIARHRNLPFDSDGQWSASGAPVNELLRRLKDDAYFHASPPKSTGFEYFNLDWLAAKGADDYEPVDVQATLAQLTADTIADAIHTAVPDVSDVLVCGGGVHNSDLMNRLAAALPGMAIATTGSAGLDPDWVEAAAFAWLAMRTSRELAGNLPSVTGASSAAVLGVVHQPPEM
jgi:anhydro-N-acetylmuramic acid kinase